MNFQDALYKAQADRITALNAEIVYLRRQMESLQDIVDTTKKPAMYYTALMNVILADDMLKDEWKRFIAVVTLHDPNIPGITCPER